MYTHKCETLAEVAEPKNPSHGKCKNIKATATVINFAHPYTLSILKITVLKYHNNKL